MEHLTLVLVLIGAASAFLSEVIKILHKLHTIQKLWHQITGRKSEAKRKKGPHRSPKS